MVGAVAGLSVVASLVLLPRPGGDSFGAGPQARLWWRTITLMTGEDGASARIDGGRPGDRVWLDRSVDGSRVADGKLTVATIPEASIAGETAVVSYAGGLLRACAEADDRAVVRCTRWTSAADPTPDRRTRAVERLIDRYDHDTGRWSGDGGTWQSANALTALIDYMHRTGDRQYVGYLDDVYRHGDVARTGVPKQTGYHDDELWWALAWIDAYDLTHEARYLTAARTIVDALDDQHASFCGGGLIWARVGTDAPQHPWDQVNSITNALYLTATAQLAVRVEPQAQAGYLSRASTAWQWFGRPPGQLLMDSSGLVEDHLDRYGDTCVVVDAGKRWTYGQGQLISGLVALSRATGDTGLLGDADRIATATTRSGSEFIDNGVLTEPSATDCPGPECHDAGTFKGVFVRAYAELLDTGRSRAATATFLTTQANSMPHTAIDDYPFRWQPPMIAKDQPNFATQAAALDVLNAADAAR